MSTWVAKQKNHKLKHNAAKKKKNRTRRHISLDPYQWSPTHLRYVRPFELDNSDHGPLLRGKTLPPADSSTVSTQFDHTGPRRSQRDLFYDIALHGSMMFDSLDHDFEHSNYIIERTLEAYFPDKMRLPRLSLQFRGAKFTWSPTILVGNWLSCAYDRYKPRKSSFGVETGYIIAMAWEQLLTSDGDVGGVRIRWCFRSAGSI